MGNYSLMKNKLSALLFLSLSFFILYSCNVEEYDLSNFTKDIMVTETAVDAPIGKVSIDMETIFLQEHAIGGIVTLDSIYSIDKYKIGDTIPFPLIATMVEISAADTLSGLNFKDVFGKYTSAIDSVEEAILKFDIVNQIPVKANLTVSFFKRVQEKESEKSVMREITAMRRTISVEKPKTDPNTQKLASANHVKTDVVLSGADCLEMGEVTDIVLSYRLRSDVGNQFVIEKSYSFEVALSAYLKAKLYFNID